MKIRLEELRGVVRDIVKYDISANSIRYGNPAAEYVDDIVANDDPIKDWFIVSGLMDKICLSAPKNDSDTTRRDLEALVELVGNVTEEDVAFAEFVENEDSLAKLFMRVLSEAGVEESIEEYYQVYNQTLSLLHYLKHRINRPRPCQLARHFGLPVFPLVRTDAQTASYPSGHALVSFVMSEYYSRKYPYLAPVLMELGEKIAKSRENVGIHYPSDTEVSRLISKILFKYGLLGN